MTKVSHCVNCKVNQVPSPGAFCAECRASVSGYDPKSIKNRDELGQFRPKQKTSAPSSFPLLLIFIGTMGLVVAMIRLSMFGILAGVYSGIVPLSFFTIGVIQEYRSGNRFYVLTKYFEPFESTQYDAPRTYFWRVASLLVGSSISAVPLLANFYNFDKSTQKTTLLVFAICWLCNIFFSIGAAVWVLYRPALDKKIRRLELALTTFLLLCIFFGWACVRKLM